MKASEIRELSDNDILEKLEDEQAALANLNFQHSIASVENPTVMRQKRMVIARLLTEMNARKRNNKSES